MVRRLRRPYELVVQRTDLPVYCRFMDDLPRGSRLVHYKSFYFTKSS